jgi:hypothetical protein
MAGEQLLPTGPREGEDVFKIRNTGGERPDDGWVGRPSHCREQEHAGHTGTDLEASVGNVAVGHTIACEVE